ncbi:MAG: FISUMP domain-containing protein, partial [Bacteroidota bacterium]
VPRPTFYQWDELMRYQTSPGAQGLCPPGWHIPSASEWNVLLNFYPGAGQAGGYLKDSLLVSGFHSYQHGFLYLNNTWAFTSGLDAGAMYWTSTTSGADRAVARGLNIFNPSVSMYPSSRQNAFGVRCLRD